MGRLIWLARQAGKQIGFRAAIISILSVLLALAASVLAPLIPYDLSLKIGAEAVDNILTILASSMLAVTTFSMTAMVTAFNGAAQNVTPRAAELLIEDGAAQNALSTFLGGFLFGIVGIIALSTGYYGAEGRAVLFIGTILMIFWIVVVLLRWIQRLSRFGRMEDTVQRVEEAALEAIDRHPGLILIHTPPEDSTGEAITSDRIGYVTHIDVGALEEAWEGRSGKLRICAPPGTFVDPATALARTEGTLDDAVRETIADAFTIDSARAFRNDPRFGVIVLSEIASRALSPAVNDPGSAISVLGAGQRIFHKLVSERAERDFQGAVGWPLILDEMVEDLIRPIARDGAGMAEVGIRLQRTLGAVADEAGNRAEMLRLARDALDQGRSSGMAPPDLERVERSSRRAFSD